MADSTNSSSEVGTTETNSSTNNQTEGSYLFFAAFFYVCAICLIIYALILTYKDPDLTTQILKDTQFNPIISALRGITLVGCAICSAIFGLALQLTQFKWELLSDN